MAHQVARSRRSSSSGAALSEALPAPGVAPASQARPSGGESEASGASHPTGHSLHRSDPNRPSDRAAANALSFSHQAPTVGLLRAGPGNAHERRIPRGRGAAAAREKTANDLRAEREPQSRSEIHLRELGHQRKHSSRTVPRLLQPSDREGTQAVHGPSSPSAQDCSYRLDSVKKGGALRGR